MSDIHCYVFFYIYCVYQRDFVKNFYSEFPNVFYSTADI